MVCGKFCRMKRIILVHLQKFSCKHFSIFNIFPVSDHGYIFIPIYGKYSNYIRFTFLMTGFRFHINTFCRNYQDHCNDTSLHISIHSLLTVLLHNLLLLSMGFVSFKCYFLSFFLYLLYPGLSYVIASDSSRFLVMRMLYVRSRIQIILVPVLQFYRTSYLIILLKKAKIERIDYFHTLYRTFHIKFLNSINRN